MNIYTSLPRKAFLFVLGFYFIAPALAQTGGSYFAEFQLSGKGRQNTATSMIQDSEGNMQMATLAGVIVFDGSNTSLVGTGAQTYVLEHVAENHKTYTGCDGRLGYIQRNTKGRFVFTRIDLNNVEDQIFSDICQNGKDVYFESSDWIIKVTDDKITGKWSRPSAGNFSGLFCIANTIFVNVSSSGLYTLQPNGKFKKHQIDDNRLAEEELYFTCPRGKNEVILGTSADEIFIFNGATLTELVSDKSAYIKAKHLFDGKRLNDKQLVIATAYGGLMVMNAYSGSVAEMFNTASGFPDDQIYSVAVDKSQGIWANHELGYTRIDRIIPVKYFSSYPGLTTRVYSVAEVNSTVYAGCSDGLYRLKVVDNNDEYEKALKQAQDLKKAQKENKANKKASEESSRDGEEIPGKTENSGNENTSVTPEESLPTEERAIDRANKKIKGIFNRIKDKIPGSGGGTTDEGELKPGLNNSYSNSPVSFQPNFSRSFKLRFAAMENDNGARFLYSKIDGITGKVKKIIVINDGIVCATNNGLFKYSAGGVENLFTGDIKDAMYFGGKVYFISSVGAYMINADKTPVPITYQSRSRNLSTIFVENGSTLWLGGTNHVLRISLNSSGAVTNEKFIETPADFPDLVSVCKSGDVIFFVSGGGLFEYNPANQTAVSTDMDVSQDNESFEYVINPAGNTLFVRSLEGWREIKSHIDKVPQGLLDVLNDVRYVFKAQNGNLWAVSMSGEIYYLNRNSPSGNSFAGFDVFIRGVQGGFNGNPFDLSDLVIDYKEGAIEIKWGSNLYLKSNGTWYQYKIEQSGRNEWSKWTKQTSLKIQLNPGNYTFVVHARDALGNMSPDRKISFSIKPPFWQTWWFYTGLALLLAGAIFFIFRWRNRALIENQKRLEAMVDERTLELGQEKEKTEGLLLNILPKAVAQELKELGQSSVRRHSESAVMFTDFCNFTKLSMNMTAEELVEKLDNYFRKFDEIVDKYGIEKIKTIGDAYMCAAGVPQAKKNASLSIVMAALEILEVVEKADPSWKIRVGIHRGGLVSGVVGKRKFAYDIWGDTVNVASRMESSSEPMNINITEQVYDQIKDFFECEKRGEIEAKSLGKTSMYFVKSLKTEYRANGNPIVPNDAFLALLN